MSTSYAEWCQRWQPSLKSVPWKQITINDTPWLVKCLFTEKSYELLISDMRKVWRENLESASIDIRNNADNPTLETSVSNLLRHVRDGIENTNGSTEYSLTCRESVKFTVTYKLPGLPPFRWNFVAQPASTDLVCDHLTEPLALMVAELGRRQKELYQLLRSKDREITDLKAQGARVSKKKLETLPFNESSFNEDCTLSKGFTADMKDGVSSVFTSDEYKDLYATVAKRSSYLSETIPNTDGEVITSQGASVKSSPSMSPEKPPISVEEEELCRRQELEKRLHDEEMKEQKKKKKKMNF